MTDDELKALETLAKTATPGPWSEPWLSGALRHIHRNVETDAFYVFKGPDDDPMSPDKDDAAFIAAARTAVPALIAEVRRLKAREIDLRRIAICIYDSRPDDTIGSLKVSIEDGGAEYLADHVVSVLKRHAGDHRR